MLFNKTGASLEASKQQINSANCSHEREVFRWLSGACESRVYIGRPLTLVCERMQHNRETVHTHTHDRRTPVCVFAAFEFCAHSAFECVQRYLCQMCHSAADFRTFSPNALVDGVHCEAQFTHARTPAVHRVNSMHIKQQECTFARRPGYGS